MKGNETIAEIAAELRGAGICEWYGIADRIEAAWAREVSRRDAEAHSGNAAKMRAALEEIYHVTRVWMAVGDISARRTFATVSQVAREALASPPRNCDVGAESAEANGREVEG